MEMGLNIYIYMKILFYLGFLLLVTMIDTKLFNLLYLMYDFIIEIIKKSLNHYRKLVKFNLIYTVWPMMN